MIDGLAASSRALDAADERLDGLTGNAQAILWSLDNQRSSLKGVQRKVRRVAHVLSCVAVQRKVQ